MVLYPPRNVRIIAHPEIFSAKYAELETPRGTATPFIGIRFRREFLEHSLGADFDFKTEAGEIAPGILYSGQIPKETAFEKPDPKLKVQLAGELLPDPLNDDISLLVETDSGPVVLLGCAHSGMINILNHFSRLSGHKTFHAVIGGTHLGFTGEPVPQFEESMDRLEAFQPDLVAVSHCTGQKGAALCAGRFGERFAFASAGWSYTC